MARSDDGQVESDVGGLPPPPPGFDLVPPTGGGRPGEEGVPLPPERMAAAPSFGALPPPPEGFKEVPQTEIPSAPEQQAAIQAQASAAGPHANDVKAPAPEQDQEAPPGYWQSISSAFTKKAAEAAASAAAGVKVTLPEGLGGTSLEAQRKAGLMEPKTKDKVDELLEEPISQGWSDSKWWAAQLGGAAGGILPGLGAAGVGTLVGGALGGIVGFGVEAAIEHLVPAYNAQIARGAAPADAVKTAIIDSGIAASFAGVMGLAGALPLNKIATAGMEGPIAEMLQRPISEAFVSMGLVQPSLMAGQDVASSLATTGELPSRDQVATDVLLGSIMGLGIHETFRGTEAMKKIYDAHAELRAAGAKPAIPAAEATIAAAAEAQRPKGAIRVPEEGGLAKAEPAAPVAPLPGPADQEMPVDGAAYDRDVIPKVGGTDFFSAVTKAVVEKMPDNMNGASAYNLIAKQPYVTRGELEWLGLKQFLQDTKGQVNKDDLLAHIESKQVQLEEVKYQEPTKDPMEPANQLYDKYAAQYGTENTNEWPVGAQRHFENVRNSSIRESVESRALEPQYRGQNPPGAQEVREFVLKVPAPELPAASVEAKAKELWNQRNVRKYGPWEGVTGPHREAFLDSARDHLYREDPRVYIGSHYAVPNGFAHFRTASYVDRNGRKLLGLMEAQSDAHQAAQGRAGEPGLGYQKNVKGLLPPQEAEDAVSNARHKFEMTRLNVEKEYMQKKIPWRDAVSDPRVLEARGAWHRSMEALEASNRAFGGGAIPDLPFKTTWQELIVKRLLQLATDGGYDGVFILNGDQVGLRLESRQQVKGVRENYNKVLPNLLQKWAKYVGTKTEQTQLREFNRDWDGYINSLVPFRRDHLKTLGLDTNAMKYNMWAPINAAHSAVISSGMPLHEKDVAPAHPVRGTRTLSDVVQTNPYPERLAPIAKKIDKFIARIANEFKVSRGISFLARPMDTDWRGRLRDGFDPATRNFVIEVNTKRILTEHDLYAASSHELGHVIFEDTYEKASDAERAGIDKAHNDFRAKIDPAVLKMEDARRIRDNAISQMTGARAMHNDYRLTDIDPGSLAYFLSKKEWFSEEFAKWMQTDEKPLKVADKFFKRLANKIRKMLAIFSKSEYGPNAKPDKAVQDFLDNRYGIPYTWMEPFDQQHEMDVTKKAAAAFDKEGAPETKAVAQLASTAAGREILKALPPELRGNGEGMAAAGDTMNWFYNLFTGLPQVVELNKHLRQLIIYSSIHRVANNEKNLITGLAQDRIQQWMGIRDLAQLKALTAFISDYANGFFKLPHTEDGVFRRPNAEEFAALVKKHGLSDQSVRLFQGITQDFDAFLDKYRVLLVNDAYRIKDPTRQRTTIENINRTMDKLAQRPFMPLTRFGKYSISVYGADGKLRHYEQTNSLRQQKKIHEALEGHVDRLPGDRVVSGMVPKDVTPFLGMPPGMIDLIADKLSLSNTQRNALDQLKFDYAPAQTFKHQFRNLDLTPGYSTDFMRAYSHFFFHGANHVTRIKWADAMRDQIASLGSDEMRLARAGRPGGANKLDKIVKYVQAHFDAFIDPKSDWAAARGVMFHWYLGFNPASAVTNLTQTALMTHPYLAAMFGDLASARAILKASTDMNNYWRRTNLQAAAEEARKSGGPGREAAKARAFGEALSRGSISETQAHNLAALSEDRNLMRIFGTKAEQGWLKFQEASSWMFEMSEQWNRRVAFAAAWDLAYDRPNHKLIQEAVKLDPILYHQLTVEKGMSSHEAGSLMAAMRAVEKTQFNYSPYARPPIMRGKIGSTALVFKLFTQNTMFNLVSHPAMLWRWMLVMGALGGMQGLMGFDNVNSLLKTIAYRAFGKDFDLEDVARHFAHDVLNDVIPSDILMHGVSAQGFGLPHLANSLGWHAFPTVDLSKSVGFGDVLGFDPFKPLGPVKEPFKESAKEAIRATGAAFSLPINLYEFAAGVDNFQSLKKYENIMPRWMGSLSKAYRYSTQGKEVNQAGNAVVRFDPADTQQMMEILARAGGFNPRRLTEEWGRVQATAQAEAYWDLMRQGLMRQFGDAVKNNDSEGRERVIEAIKKFNDTLPDEAKPKAITSKALKASVHQRLRVQALQEQGLPAQKSNILISKEIEKYYPRGWPKDLQDVKPVQ